MRKLTSKHIDIEETAGHLINLWILISEYTAEEIKKKKKDYIEQLYQLIK